MPSSGFDNLSVNKNKIASKRSELEQLANSKDGKAVQALLHGKEASVQKALENGNTDALHAVMNDLMQSEAGRAIIAQLSDLMK